MSSIDSPTHSLRSFHRFNNESSWQDRADMFCNQLAAALLIALLAPVMLVIGALVWFSGRSSVFYGHYRVSQSGKLFKCLKFRSMYPDADRMLEELLASDPAIRAEWDREQKLANDPRITPIGRLLRSTSLDELPQLFNVLQGHMRLVGPRPITVSELGRYGSARWHYLTVRPGMTGLWQVSGRNNTSYEERVALDRSYVEKRSLTLDLSILVRTVKVVLLRHGAR